MGSKDGIWWIGWVVMLGNCFFLLKSLTESNLLVYVNPKPFSREVFLIYRNLTHILTTMTTYIVKKVFFVSFAIFLVGFFVMGLFVWQGTSFNLFKVWTIEQNLKLGSDFVRVGEVSSPIVGTVLAQMKVGQGSYYGSTSFGTSMRLYDQTAALVEVDILKLLRESRNPEQVLQMHLWQMEKALEDIQANYDALSELARTKREESEACLQRKRAWDQEFFDGVNQDDPGQTQTWLDVSLEYAPCYITNRIEANAYEYMAQRVTAYSSLISRRNQTLASNAETLVSSFPLLHGDIAQQLVWLQQQLQHVNTTDFSSFDDFFSFSVPPVGTAPSLQNVRFRDNSISVPTFEDPIKRLGKE